MKVTTLDESVIQDIGHAFGYYDYGTERGLINAFPSREPTAVYISGYVRMTLRGGILYSTGENGCALSGVERAAYFHCARVFEGRADHPAG